MKNLLRNKVVVSCLAVIACLGAAANFVKLPNRTQLSAAARAAVAQPATPAETFEVPPPLTIRQELISWTESPASERPPRDPFAWPRHALAGSTNATVGPPLPFRLQAISIEADKAFAVLNQRVVSTGEKLGDYLVERILPTEVWLRGPAGRVVVRLAR